MSTQPAPKLLNVAEIRRLAPTETFKSIVIVSNLIKKTDKNGKPYWEISVSDQCGNMNAKVWSDAGWWNRSAPDLESKPDLLSEEEIQALRGKTVGITGKVTDFRGQPQYNFNAISLLNQDKFPPTQYVAHSDVPLPILLSRLEEVVDACRPAVRDFLRQIFAGELGKMFRDAPAAVSNHHAYAHGLLGHTLTVTESARAMANCYRNVYPTLDIDVVVAGALLHDIGKIHTYAMAPIPEMTLAGAVLDHIAIGYALFVRLAEEGGLDPMLQLEIGHILLSHHGQKEFGSPVLPATLEALIVSAADELDFRLFCWKDAVKDLAPDQSISAFHFAAQRRFWKTPPRDAAERPAEGGGAE